MTDKKPISTTSMVASVVSIPGYEILDVLGKGGMATVYLAKQQSIGREIALKILAPDHSDDSFTERFLREARIISQLTHPNIITIYDAGVHQGMHYMAMEYIKGMSLREARDRVTRQQKIQIVKQICKALDFAGKKGFVHRDIKPENILLQEEGRVVLTDFGIARSSDVSKGLTLTGKVLGTPYYMSPEQTKGIKVDHRSDIYSLGVVLFQALTGYLPFDGPSLVAIGIKHLSDPIPTLSPGLEIFQPIINKAMSKEPVHRYQSGSEFLTALNQISDADLDFIEAKSAAYKKQGKQHSAETIISDGASPGPASNKNKAKTNSRKNQPGINIANDQVPSRHSAHQAMDITDTDDFKRLKRRRSFLLLLLLGALSGTAYYYQTELLAYWKKYFPADNSTTHTDTTTQTTSTAATADVDNVQISDVTTDEVTTHSVKIKTDSTISPEDKQRILNEISGLKQQLNEQPENATQIIQHYKTLSHDIETQAIAAAGLDEMKNWYQLQIRSAIDNKDATIARQLLNAYQTDFTDIVQSEQFRVIEQSLLRLEAVHAHIEKAQLYIRLEQYISPANENALEEYQYVLSLDKKNQAALDGVSSIANHFYQLAKNNYSENHLHEALINCQSGLKAHPTHAKLLKLQGEIQTLITHQQHIQSLLADAQKKFSAGQFIQPVGASAYDSYKKVLSEEPSNVDARDGIKNIEAAIVEKIDAYIWSKDYDKATTLIAIGLRYYPTSINLDAANKRLVKSIDKNTAKIVKLVLSHDEVTSLEQAVIAPPTGIDLLYVGFKYADFIQETTVLDIQLIDKDNNQVVAKRKAIVSQNRGENYFSIKSTSNVNQSGNYIIEFIINNKSIGQFEFNIK